MPGHPDDREGNKASQDRMAAQSIPVGVYALDQFDLPERRAGVGLAARLSEAHPVLHPNPGISVIHLVDGESGMVLSQPLALSGEDLPEGVRVTVEALAGLTSLLLVRAGGRPVGLAPAGSGIAADKPELLTAFVAGTLIDTPDGPVPVERLAAGDRVTTLANGSRPLIWVGKRRILPVEIMAYPGLRPLSLPKGSAGNDRPMLVSPRQRMLIDDWRAEVYFGEDRVLVAAEALSDRTDTRPDLPADGIDYVMLLCDRHEILIAEGALTESFHPGEAGLAAMTPDERAALSGILPEAELIRRRSAYPIIRNAEARALRILG